ncbi:hypothetical protein F183_A06220 [Bryobacterales bacterium F-183]|nr:hypothetical protein F183_A06220 [Bryobacterales bacterium F-183]
MKTPILASVAAFGALCFLPSAMFAPDGAVSTDPGRPLSLREYLNLSDSQVRKLEDLQARRKDSARASIENLEQKQKALRTRLASNATGPLAVGSAVLQLELAKTRAEITTTELTQEAVAVLTPAQLAKLHELERLRKLQPVIREASAKFLIAPPDAIVNGSGPLGMFSAPWKRQDRPKDRPQEKATAVPSPRALAVSLPDAAQHTEHDQVMKLAVE